LKGNPGGQTVAQRLAETAGHSSGFDYLRLVLSICVIASHAPALCCGRSHILILSDAWRAPVDFILPCFFSLSGFLVAGSLLRVGSIRVFATLRALRIFPALCAEVILSAFLLGPLLTEATPREYFTSPMLVQYFLNVVGDIHYVLPGVFIHNPVPNLVNYQLWTIPFELECYIALALLAIIGFVKRPLLLLSIVVLATAGLLAYDIHAGQLVEQPRLMSGHLLVISFLCGVLFFLYREHIRLSAAFCVAAAAVSLLLLYYSTLHYLAPLAVTYVTVYLGLLNPRKIGVLRSGDYSYGLYLYGYPIQQAISQLLPQYRFWWVNFGLGLLLAGAAAYISWTLLESRVLNNKRAIIARLEAAVRRFVLAR
jgi:peptidoglycan/LPS O-acetylase OafA/YrhL